MKLPPFLLDRWIDRALIGFARNDAIGAVVIDAVRELQTMTRAMRDKRDRRA